MRTYSSILPFTNRFGLQRATCITNDAQNIGGGVTETPLPNFLYKYTSPNVKRILEVIRDGEVYFPSPLDFNDPFDCRHAADVSTRKKREKIVQEANDVYERLKASGHDVSWMLTGEESKKHKQKIIDDPKYAAWAVNEDVTRRMMLHTRLGIYSLTKKCDNVLMWAHYAKNHEGVCFQFDLRGRIVRSQEDPQFFFACYPFDFLCPVKYDKKYPFSRMGKEDFLMVCATKSKEWKYEDEWRAIMLDATATVGGTNQPFLPGDEGTYRGVGKYCLKDGLLSGVILGCRIKKGIKKRVVRMAKDRNIKVWQARINESKYGLDIEPYSE